MAWLWIFIELLPSRSSRAKSRGVGRRSEAALDYARDERAPSQQSLRRLFDLDHAAADLVELDALKQRLEVAVAKAFITLALNDLEEDRADERLGENLQQQ